MAIISHFLVSGTVFKTPHSGFGEQFKTKTNELYQQIGAIDKFSNSVDSVPFNLTSFFWCVSFASRIPDRESGY